MSADLATLIVAGLFAWLAISVVTAGAWVVLMWPRGRR